jgi:hypothetical protein
MQPQQSPPQSTDKESVRTSSSLPHVVQFFVARAFVALFGMVGAPNKIQGSFAAQDDGET